MAKAKPILNIQTGPLEGKLDKVQRAVNANAPPPPGGGATPAPPPPKYTALAAALANVKTILGDIADKKQILAARFLDLNGAVTVMEDAYRDYGKDVDAETAGIASEIVARGYDLASTAKRLTSLPVVESLGAATGDADHSVHLNWNRLTGATSYAIQHTTDPTGQTGWTLVDVCTTSNYDVLNLPAGTHLFRVAGRAGRKVQGPWSQHVHITIG